MPIPTGAPAARRDWWIDVALVVLVLALAGPIVQVLGAQQASRQALTAAIWDQHTLQIDDYPIGIDRAEHDGHIYSDKAPGQPFFAVPAYALYRFVGGEPATVMRVEGNLGLWTTSVWSSLLPIAALAILLRRALARVDEALALPATVAILVATLLLPFSSLLFGHSLSAALGFGAWYVASRPGGASNRALWATGGLLGLAVLTEYTLGFVVVGVLGYCLYVYRGRAWRVVAGGVPSIILLLLYQWAAFGSPFEFSYANSSFDKTADAVGLENTHPSVFSNGLHVLAGERGFLVVTPILLMAALGMAVLIRRSELPARAAYISAAVCAGLLVAMQVVWSNPTGGDSPGPRYATAAAAFLAPGLVVAWRRWPRWCIVLAVWGAVVMIAATWTNPLQARDSTNAVGIWLGDLFSGDWATTIYGMALGSAGQILLPIGAVLAAVLLFRAGDAAGRARPRRRHAVTVHAPYDAPLPWRRILLACVVSTAIAVALVGYSAVQDGGIENVLFAGELGPAARVLHQDFEHPSLLEDDSGHDGQHFYVLARALPHLRDARDDLGGRPGYRAQRISLPLLARLLHPMAGGGSGLVTALLVANGLGLLAGAIGISVLVAARGGAPWVGALFPWLPACLQGLQLTLADAFAAGLALAALAAVARRRPALAVGLGLLALLGKEAALFTLAGWILWGLVRRIDRGQWLPLVLAPPLAALWFLSLRWIFPGPRLNGRTFVPPLSGFVGGVQNTLDGVAGATWLGLATATIIFVGLVVLAVVGDKSTPWPWVAMVLAGYQALLTHEFWSETINAQRFTVAGAAVLVVVLGTRFTVSPRLGAPASDP